MNIYALSLCVLAFMFVSIRAGLPDFLAGEFYRWSLIWDWPYGLFRRAEKSLRERGRKPKRCCR